MADAPSFQRGLSWGLGLLGWTRKPLGRVRLLHLSSPRGAQLVACADPSVARQRKTHTTSRTSRQFIRKLILCEAVVRNSVLLPEDGSDLFSGVLSRFGEVWGLGVGDRCV